MTTETLERANNIYSQIKRIEESIERAEYMKDFQFGIEIMSMTTVGLEFIPLPERCTKKNRRSIS